MGKYNPGDKVKVIKNLGSGAPLGEYVYVSKTEWDTEYIKDADGWQWAVCEEEMEWA